MLDMATCTIRFHIMDVERFTAVECEACFVGQTGTTLWKLLRRIVRQQQSVMEL